MTSVRAEKPAGRNGAVHRSNPGAPRFRASLRRSAAHWRNRIASALGAALPNAANFGATFPDCVLVGDGGIYQDHSGHGLSVLVSEP
jgi:hypothetical protein